MKNLMTLKILSFLLIFTIFENPVAAEVNVTFNTPTPVNGTYATDYLYVNATAETSSGTITQILLEFENSNVTMTLNSSIAGSRRFGFINLTNLANGNYSYRVFMNNSATEGNLSPTRHINIIDRPCVDNVCTISLTPVRAAVSRAIQSTAAADCQNRDPDDAWTLFGSADNTSVITSNNASVAIGEASQRSCMIFNYSLPAYNSVRSMNVSNEGCAGSAVSGIASLGLSLWNHSSQSYYRVMNNISVSDNGAGECTGSGGSGDIILSVNVTQFGNLIDNNRSFLVLAHAVLTDDGSGVSNYYMDYVFVRMEYVGALPNMSFVSPTSTNTTIAENYIYVNVTVDSNSGNNIDVCTLEWNNVNESMTRNGAGTSVFCSVNKTSLTSGSYTYRVFANDTQGLVNSTTRTTTVNSVPIINSITLNAINLGGALDLRIYINVTDITGAGTRSRCYINGSTLFNSTFIGDFCTIDIANSLTNSLLLFANDTLNGTSSAFNITFALSNVSINYTQIFSKNNTIQIIELNNTLNFTGGSPFNYTINYSIQTFSGTIGINLSSVNITGSVSASSNATIFANWSGDWINETRFNYNLSVGTTTITINENVTGYLEASIQNLVSATANDVLINITALLPSGWVSNTSDDLAYYVNLTSSQTNRTNSTIRGVIVSNITILSGDCTETDYSIFGGGSHCRYSAGSEFRSRIKINVTDSVISTFNVSLEFPIGFFPEWKSTNWALVNFSVNGTQGNLTQSDNSTTIIVRVPENFSASSLRRGAHFAQVVYTVAIQTGGGGGGGGGHAAQAQCGNNICETGENNLNCRADCLNLTFSTSPEYWLGQVIKPGESAEYFITILNSNPDVLALSASISPIDNTSHQWVYYIDENGKKSSTATLKIPEGSKTKPTAKTLKFIVEPPQNIPDKSYTFGLLLEGGGGKKALSFGFSTSGIDYIGIIFSPIFKVKDTALAFLELVFIPAVWFILVPLIYFFAKSVKR